jgi:large subunit ribosomal protein L28
MAYQCDICGKKKITGNNVSHSKEHTRRRWLPNLQTIRAVLANGSVKRIKVCTTCIKSGKVTKASPRNYKKPEAVAAK